MVIGFVIDPLDGLKIKKDSSVLLLQTALERGLRVWCWQDNSMIANSSGVSAAVLEIDTINLDASPWYASRNLGQQQLSQCDIVMMRKDPPVDMRFIYATYLLSLLEQSGVRVVNRPQALREYNEKLAILRFPQAIPPTIVTAQMTAIHTFLAQQQDIILKPLNGMGGASIYRLRQDDPNVNVIIDQLSASGKQAIMAQRYLTEIVNGDHRLLVINGKPLDYTVARLAKTGETRANLALGGRAEVRPLTARQLELGLMVGAVGKKEGITIIGLDVIGDFITEINVTCPTCMRELLNATGINAAALVFDSLIGSHQQLRD